MLLALLLLTGCATPGVRPSMEQQTCLHQDEDDNGSCDSCFASLLVAIDLYNINDLHGKLADGEEHPGVDELSTYFERVRQSDSYVILLSSGDMWQGSAESNMTKGKIITDWMNEMDFAAMTLGNHEFDWGESYIEKNATLAEFPFLAINIYNRQTDSLVEYCKPSVIIEKGGVQVGIIGAIGDCYSSISPDHTKDIYFKTGSELTALVKAESEKLRQQGADLIVYALHDGSSRSSNGRLEYVTDSSLRSYYDISLSDGYVDLVFEGHSHQRYLQQDSYGVYHLQGGGDNDGITHVEIRVNSVTGTYRVTQREYISTSEYDKLPDDPVVDNLLQKYEDDISSSNRIVGYNAAFRNSNTLRQVVAQLYLQAGIEKWGDEYDIVLGGGYLTARSPYDLQQGQVTYATLQAIFPFDNELVLCSVKGSDLLSKFINSGNANYFIARSDNRSIDPNGTYYIVVDSYTSTYAPNRLTEIQRYGADIFARDLLADYIEAGHFS